MLLAERLSNKIKAALDCQAAKQDENDSPQQSRQELADDLAAAIIAEIKQMSIQIIASAGQVPVTVVTIVIT
jgi:hypothetical protein